LTFAREKRLLLGVAALLAPLPLPLNDALEWPALAAYLLAIGAFLRRAHFGSERWLSNRTLNLLGLLYLPVLVVDFAATGQIQLVRPILHLTLFGIAAKLWSLSRERDKWQTWIGIFFVFLAAMATSVHPAVLLYLIAFLGVTVGLLVRFVYLHVLSSFGHREPEAPALPLGKFVAVTLAATLLVAAPLFAILPRVRGPYLLAGGPSGGSARNPAAGFSDEMSLDLIGRIRGNPEVALRIELAGRHPAPGTLRLKAATYEAWEGRRWRRSDSQGTLRKNGLEDVFRLGPGVVAGNARIRLEPLRASSLPVPVETVAVDAEIAALRLDEGGALFVPGIPSEPLEYTARLGVAPSSAAAEPGAPEDRSLDQGGVTDRIRGLAAEWAGEGTAAERAARIERRLLTEYGYTLDFIGRGGDQPLEHFLFEAKRGHCEYFASAMVLLLRAEGIPSRLVTGFYGAEQSYWDAGWIVRQSNAHAWVEAYLPDAGWTTFDPTPPVGRPLGAERGVWLSMRQAYESLVLRWDRYVLSYDFYDQVGVATELRRIWEQLSRAWFGEDTTASRRAPAGSAPAEIADPGTRGGEGAPPWLLPGVSGFAVLAAIAGALLWRRRAPWTFERAYLHLRAAVAGSGQPVPESLAPLAFADLARRRVPAAAAAVDRLVATYVESAFGGRGGDEAALARSREDLEAVERALRERRRRIRRRV